MPIPIPESLYVPVAKFLFEKLPGWIDLLIKRSAIVVAIASVLVGTSTYFFYRYLSESRQMADAMISTVKADLEPTPQRFKGLEAFILSHIDIVNTQHQIQSSTFADGFQGAYKQFMDDASGIAQTASAQQPLPVENGCSAKAMGTLLVINTPFGDPIVTDEGCKGFLFIPQALVRGSVDMIDKPITERVNSDKYLERDILLTRRVAASLDKFLKPLIDATNNKAKADEIPAQVYLIARSGINRILSQSISDPAQAREYYGKQFSSNTYFPGRPYFLAATRIAHPKPLVELENTEETKIDLTDKLIGDYFYVSAPYLDLGGNGIIVTLSRPIRLRGYSDFVLCFDLPLQDQKLETILTTMVSQFSGHQVLARLRVNSKGNPKIADAWPPKEQWDDEQSELIKKATQRLQSGTDMSEFFGNVQELDQNGTHASAAAVPSTAQVESPLALSIPLGDLKFENSERSAKFAFLKLDFGKHRKQIGRFGLLACTSFGVLTVLLALVWGVAVKDASASKDLVVELGVAFDRVSRVMAEAPVPYALVDANDYISTCNAAFASLLQKDKDVLQGHPFRQLISDKDRYLYDGVEKRRRNNEAVPPYKLRMDTDQGKEVTVWVVSAAVPAVGQEPGAMPRTFGIMLTSPPTSAEVINISPKPTGITKAG